MADNQHYRQQQPRQEDRFQWQQQQPSLSSSSPFVSYQPPPLSSFHSSHPPSSTSPPPAIPYLSRPPYVQQQQQQQQQQQLPHPYQPATPARPQVSSQQLTQAHSHTYHQQQQQPHQQHQPPFPHTHNNFAIPRRESSYSALSDQPKFSHPLSVQDVHLESPQPHFATFEHISSSLSDRPSSVASFSNLSSRSNEAFLHSRAPSSGESTPLVSENLLLLNNEQQQQQTPTPRPRKQKRPFDRMNVSAPPKTYYPAHQQALSSRSITPQPWHPDDDGNTQRLSRMDLLDNPLKGDPHRRSSSRSSSESNARRGGRKNNNEKNGQAQANGGLVKTRKGIFSRLHRARTYIEYDNRKTGRFAQFSNERLYLHWIRFGVLQGSIAVTLLSFGIGVASYIGVGALVLALTTLIYSTTLYHTRHMYMVAKRQDILYYERVIPTLLALGLVVLYAANFGSKCVSSPEQLSAFIFFRGMFANLRLPSFFFPFTLLVTMTLGDAATSPPPWLSNDVHF